MPGPDDLDDDFLDEEEPADELDEEPDEDSPEPEEDDEPLAAEADDEDEPVQPARPARKPFAQRVNEVAERIVTERMKKFESEFAARSSPSQPTETAAQRAARLAEMEPWDRVAYETNERLSRLEWEGSERLDQISFAQTCREDPTAARLKDEVEARLASMRRNGFNTSRDVLYTQILGERARANKGRATSRAAKTAAVNRAQQTTRPGSSRTDAVQTDTRRGDTRAGRARRLQDVNI